jgi:hypothetical protein
LDIVYFCLAGYKKNPVDERGFLKSPDGIIDYRMAQKFQKLLVDVAAHPFSLTCCQDNGCTRFSFHLLFSCLPLA